MSDAREGKLGAIGLEFMRRLAEAVTSRSVWMLAIATAGAKYVVDLHAAGKASETVAMFALGTWVATFLIAAAKRGAVQVAGLNAKWAREGNGTEDPTA